MMKLKMQKMPLFLMVLFLAGAAMADYEAPTVKTNVNKQTDLFEKSIDNHKVLQKQLEQDKATATAEMNNNPKGLSYLSNKSASEIDGAVGGLKSIKASELTSKGQEEFAKERDDVDLAALHPDYTKPLVIKYKEDAEKIAKASEDLLANLLGKLKDIGVDCKTVKGDKIMEPEYTIKITQEPTRAKGETLYDKKVCEELRNTYNCNDSVKLTCKQKAKQYRDWQVKETSYTGQELYNNHRDWVKFYFWKSTWTRKTKHKGEIQESAAPAIRDDIAAKLKVGVDQIEIMIFERKNKSLFRFEKKIKFISSGAVDLMEWPSDRFRMYVSYPVYYKFREADEICAQWSEEWTERCKIQ
jgi:hypothetical protein